MSDKIDAEIKIKDITKERNSLVNSVRGYSVGSKERKNILNKIAELDKQIEELKRLSPISETVKIKSNYNTKLQSHSNDDNIKIRYVIIFTTILILFVIFVLVVLHTSGNNSVSTNSTTEETTPEWDEQPSFNNNTPNFDNTPSYKDELQEGDIEDYGEDYGEDYDEEETENDDYEENSEY